ncbi:hypothetical protein M3Y98_00576200 [Aphelenchoides besseyi]|nr:hypothetical protein M3Y98_00576200 [Aphelenchoides besseyi]KAI6193839.1 hypothetical protein M3Y96_01061400 [Aphelenchoides besseyi]
MFRLFFFLLSLCFDLTASINRPSIFCLIHTTASAHNTRLATILETWAKRCDEKLVFTDAPLHIDVPHVYFPFMNTRDHSWEKIRRVFRYVYETTNNQYDWYLRADDDSYVVMDNARQLVEEYNPKTPLVLGYRWGFFEPRGYVDGGVYIVSNKGMEVFNKIMKNDSICPDFHRAEEDQELGRCMAKVGIYPTDTRDTKGRERFHHFHVDELDNRWLKEFIKQNAFYGYKEVFPQEISDSSVSFHHISPYEMQVVEYLTHRLKRKDSLEESSFKKTASFLEALKSDT